MCCDPPPGHWLLSARLRHVFLPFTKHFLPYPDFSISAENQVSYLSSLSQLTCFSPAILDDRERGFAGQNRPACRYVPDLRLISSITDTFLHRPDQSTQEPRRSAKSTNPAPVSARVASCPFASRMGSVFTRQRTPWWSSPPASHFGLEQRKHWPNTQQHIIPRPK